jgi:Flp pilus assembly pilin Flp
LSSSILEQFECEAAQTAAEYAVVLGVITLAIVTTIGLVSGSIQSVLERVTTLL